MNLLMLTKTYPFGIGESFIENEINIIAKYYNKIVIIACEVSNNENEVRKLPNNVTAYKIPIKTKIYDIIHSITNKSNDLRFKNEKINCSNLLQKIFLQYFESKAQRIYKTILLNGYFDNYIKDSYMIYSYWLFTTARIGILISEVKKPVTMFTRAHGYDLYEYRNSIKYLPFRRLFLEKYDLVLPCSNDGEKYLKNLYPDISDNVHTAYLGTNDYGLGKGSNDGVFRIVSCSRIEPVKRIERIIDTLALLDNMGLKITWTHIGSGSCYENIKKYTETKIHNIKYRFCGNMKNKDIMNLYSTNPFDLFLNVSSSEGLPVSIMEALSFGIPCVATDVGGTSEIVIDGITGKLIPKDFQDNELANIIKNLSTNRSIKFDRVLCRRFWEEHFQANINYRRLHNFLSKKSY